MSAPNDSQAAAPHVAPQIDLVDHTVPQDEAPEQQTTDPPTGDEGPSTPLSRRWTKLSSHTNLRGTLERRRYAKWTEARFSDESDRPTIDLRTSNELSEPGTPAAELPQRLVSRQATNASSALRSGPRKLKRMLTSRKKLKHDNEGDTVLDTLYENQRGTFFLGVPLFASRSLLQIDPPAWMTAAKKPSPVSIHNAQVPDPSWKWSWKAWYVDMSRDVDEEGWEYSFAFQNRFSWHGTHPWLHSFVRRRRWIRLRERIAPQANRTADGRPLIEAHKLNPDYFTIHPADARPAPLNIGDAAFSPVDSNRLDEEPAQDEDLDDISDIPTLLKRLNKAAIDREKMNVVLQFMDQGGDELQYLPDKMSFIMSQFMFQYSRRQLLTKMIQKMDAASQHRRDHQQRKAPEFHNEKEKIDNLLKAVEAADEQIQKLEYWSDIKQMVETGESAGGADDRRGWEHGWEGIDSSGPEKVVSSAEEAAGTEASPASPARATAKAPSDHEPDSDTPTTADDAASDGAAATDIARM